MPAIYSYDGVSDSYIVIGGCGDATIVITDTHNDGTNGTKPVTRIQTAAFINCTSLQTLTIGNSVTSIGGGAFRNCTSLTNVAIGNSVTSINSATFENCTSLQTLTIGNSVTSIGGMAFQNCTSLTSVIIPDSVLTISLQAFSGCTSLQTLTIGSSVTSIDILAFSGCTSLTSIIIPDSVLTIGTQAFYDCTSLTSVTIGSSVTSIGNYAFRNTSINNITIPNSVTNIGPGAFWGTDLVNAVIPNSVTTLGDSVFVECSSLASLTLPSNGTINTVPQGLCVLCTSLTSITIPSNYTTIAQDAFIFSGLRTVILNEGLLTIGVQAFYGCPLDQGEFIIPNSVTAIGVRAFEQTGSARFVIGTGVTELRSHTFYLSDMTDITFRSPSSLTTIGPGCFHFCNNLNNLYIPDSVTDYIFYSIDPDCNIYEDPPFYRAVKLGGTLRIGSGLIYPPRQIYTNRPPFVPPCNSGFTAGTLSNLGKILYFAGGTTLILGKSITSISNGSFSNLWSFGGLTRRVIIFEGKMTSIGADTFNVIADNVDIYFNDFTTPFSMAENALNFFSDKIYINPKVTIRIE